MSEEMTVCNDCGSEILLEDAEMCSECGIDLCSECLTADMLCSDCQYEQDFAEEEAECEACSCELEEYEELVECPKCGCMVGPCCWDSEKCMCKVCVWESMPEED